MPLAAICPVHGVFESRAFVALDSTATVTGASESCPQCWRDSPLVEGTFGFDSHGVATALAAPSWTHEALAALRDRLSEVETVAADAAFADAHVDILAKRLADQLAEREPLIAEAIINGVKGETRSRKRQFLEQFLTVLGALVLLREAGGYTLEAVEAIVQQVFSR